MASQKKKQTNTASSLGGRIKVKKNETSNFIIIHSEEQLNNVIDNTESVEMSQNTSSESPSSAQVDKHNGIFSHNKSPRIDRGSTHHLSSHTDSEHRNGKRSLSRYAPSTTSRNTNRNQQWQRMHRKQNPQYDQPRYGHRYQQQDRGREIDLSPGQYNDSNHRPRLSSYDQQPPRRTNYRNY